MAVRKRDETPTDRDVATLKRGGVRPKRSRTPPLTFATVSAIAHGLADVEDGWSYGTPALKVHGKLFVRLREDIDSIVVKMPFDQRDAYIAADPRTFHITDHYLPYEWILVRLSTVTEAALREVLEVGHTALVNSKRRRPSK